MSDIESLARVPIDLSSICIRMIYFTNELDLLMLKEVDLFTYSQVCSMVENTSRILKEYPAENTDNATVEFYKRLASKYVTMKQVLEIL